MKQLNATKVAAKETKAFSSKDSIATWIMEDSEELVEVLKTKIKTIERQLDELVQGNTQIKELFELAISVKGIGKINALQFWYKRLTSLSGKYPRNSILGFAILFNLDNSEPVPTILRGYPRLLNASTARSNLLYGTSLPTIKK